MNIYLACSLTHVPRFLFDSYVNSIHCLALALESENCGTVKYALVNSDPQLAEKPLEDKARLCYLWDRKMVENADLIVSEASFPSTGLGIEMQIAEAKDIPIILCFRDYGKNKADPIEYKNPDQKKHCLQIGEGYISLMALGMPNIFRVIKYQDTKDCILKVISTVQLFRANDEL